MLLQQNKYCVLDNFYFLSGVTNSGDDCSQLSRIAEVKYSLSTTGEQKKMINY
jgi:hypothetical protein